MSRCYFESEGRGYELYGGRGIRVEKRWHKFENFLMDMGERPEGHSIDRINPNGNYERGNCRWSTRWEQSQNKRQKKAPFIGVGWVKSLDRWCAELTIDKKKVFKRYGKGGDRSIETARRLSQEREEFLSEILRERPELRSKTL